MSAKQKPKETFEEYGMLRYTKRDMPIVYGPRASRRLGNSLGINLLGNGSKVCSFDCPYCDLGRTELRLNRLKSEAMFPTIEEIEAAVGEGFTRAHQSLPKVSAIAISGNGEPTLHPLFGEAIDVIVKARAAYLPETPIVVFTNGATLDSRRIVEALNKVDQRMLKIDAGNELMFKEINAPLVRASISKILSHARLLKDVTVQSFFVQGAIDNTQSSDIEDWIEVIGLIKPSAVHIHGMDRMPAVSGLIRCDEDMLYTIASLLERRTQIKSLVFP